MLYKAILQDEFEKAREFPDFSIAERKGLDKGNEGQHASLRIRVAGRAISRHRDKRDSRTGLFFGICYGDFETCDVILEDLGLRIVFRPGDIFVMKACYLTHAVTEILGSRVAIIWTSKHDRATIKKHIEQLPGGLEKDDIIAAKADRDRAKKEKFEDNQEAELKLIAQSRQAEDGAMSEGVGVSTAEMKVKINGVPYAGRKLEEAVAHKKKRLRELSRPNATQELDQVTKMPASVFYEFNGSEQKRFNGGYSPWEAMTKRGGKSTSAKKKKVGGCTD
jgi:hypothetical protein